MEKPNKLSLIELNHEEMIKTDGGGLSELVSDFVHWAKCNCSHKRKAFALTPRNYYH